MNKYLAIFCFFIFLFSCSRKYATIADHYQLTTHQDCAIFINKSNQSGSGMILCGKDTLIYNLGENVHSGPMSDIEKFKLAFKGRHHVDFFEKVHIDSKLYQLFIDSVRIIDIEHKSSNKKMLFECQACNRVAIIQFRKSLHRFPFYSDQLEMTNDYTFYFDSIGDYKRKIYLSNAMGPSGLHFEPLFNARLDDKFSIVTNESSDLNHVLDLLRSVRLIKK